MKVTPLHPVGSRQVPPSPAWLRLRQLDLGAPCYRSYPTPDHFVDTFDARAYRRWLARRRMAAHSPLGLWIQRVDGAGLTPAQGAQALEREVALVAAALGRPQAVTRTYWAPVGSRRWHPGELERLFGALRDAFHIRASGDHAIEVALAAIEPGTVAALVALGFNRLAIRTDGSPPAPPTSLAVATGRLVDAARMAGFRSIGLELACGTAGRRASDFARMLDEIVALGLTRITIDDRGARDTGDSRSTGVDASAIGDIALIHARSHERLAAAGYQFIGLGQFALPDDGLAVALRAGRLYCGFQGYSDRPEDDLVGLGPTAISRIGASYSQNLASPAAHAAAVERGELPVERGIELGPDDLARRAIIVALCGQGRVSIESIEIAHLIEFRTCFAEELAALAPWIAAGLVDLDDEWISVEPAGRPYLHAIAACFDRYRRARAGRGRAEPLGQ